MKPIIARSTGGDFENPESGSYIARCYKMIDIGTQETTFLNVSTGLKRQLLVWFELLADEDDKEYRMSDGQPFGVMQRYTLSLNSKATLRKHIDAWRGKPLTDTEAEEFDVTKLLDKYCRIQVQTETKDGKTYSNIVSLSHTKKKPAGVNEVFGWTIEDPDMEEFAKFPEWLQTKVNSAQEWVQQTDGTVPKSGTITPKGDVVIDDIDEDPVDLEELDF